MRLGIGSYTYPFHVMERRLSHRDILDIAISLGADAVQYCENLSLLDLDEVELGELLSQASDFSIRLEVGTRGLDASNLARHADLAHRAGSGFIRMVVHEPGAKWTANEAIDRLAGALDRLDGVAIAIENHDLLPVADLLRIIDVLGSDRVGITLDTANSLGCLEGTNEVVNALAPYTRCLHIKDVRATRLPTMLGFTITGTPAGQGGLDIPSIVGRMPACCESAILEQWPPCLQGSPPPFDLESESARQGFAFLREVMSGHVSLPCGVPYP